MSNVETDKLKALQAHWEKFRCKHTGETELRKRTVRGGGVQFVEQCLQCGAATTNPLARAKAIEINGGVEPLPFDDELERRWREASKQGAEKITGHFETLSEFQIAEFHKWYEVYLASDEWKNKKHKVLKRAKNTCEGCGDARAEVVHHLTYKNVGEEFLFELVALCHLCHNRYHENEEKT